MYIVVVHPFEADTFNPLSTLDPFRESDDQLPKTFHPEKGPFHPAKGPFLPPGDPFNEPLPEIVDPYTTDEAPQPKDPRRGGTSEPRIHTYDPHEDLIPKPIDLRGGGISGPGNMDPRYTKHTPTPREAYQPGRDNEDTDDEIELSPRRGYLPTHETRVKGEDYEPTRESGERVHPPDLYDLAMPGAVPTVALGVNLGMVVSVLGYVTTLCAGYVTTK